MAGFGHIAIVGTGVTGLAVARAAVILKGRGELDSIVLVKPEGVDSLTGEERALIAAGVRVVAPETFSGSFDLAVVSPGISPNAALFMQAIELADEVVSEPEFAFRVSPDRWIAVTGTNGKTTTTSIVAHVLQGAGMSARAVGNIGPTCIEAAISRTGDDWLVAELSSYQLHSTKRFHPYAAVISNITPDHLTWHGGLEHYTEAKLKVFANMCPGEVVVYDRSDPGALDALTAAAVTCADGPSFQAIDPRDGEAPEGVRAYVENGVLYARVSDGPTSLLPASDLRIHGEHNVANALLAAVVCLEAGLSSKQVGEGLSTFMPIAHRIEPVGRIAEARYFNDSKATNPEASMKAIAAFGTSPVILLLGGLDKGTDISGLVELARLKAREIVVFGQAAERFEREFTDRGVPVRRTRLLADAVTLAHTLARPDDVVLLSPACASFDEFDSFEHRGDAFRAMVANLAAGATS